MTQFNTREMGRVLADVLNRVRAKGMEIIGSEAMVDEAPNGRDLYIVQIGAAKEMFAERIVEARTTNDGWWSIQCIGAGFSSYKEWQEQGWIYAEFPQDVEIADVMVQYLTEEGAYRE